MAEPAATMADVEPKLMSLDAGALKPRRKGVRSHHMLAAIGVLALVVLAVLLPLLMLGQSTDAPSTFPTGPAVHFGFPICYTSFVNYNTEWTNNPPVPQDESTSWNQGTEMRPVSGHILLPYQNFTASQCAATEAPLAALGPHLVGLGLTFYEPTSTVHAFPDAFVGKLMVTAHGSWNRAPWIGHRIDAFDIDRSSEPYAAVARDIFVPPMRVRGSGTPDRISGTGVTHTDYEAIRPVDVRSSPADGSLLFTADRDDLMEPEVGHNAGGLYRVIYGPPAVSTSSVEAPVPYDMSGTSLGGLIGGDANFSLQRLAVLPCARQMAVSPTSRLLFVSTLKEFCAHSLGDDTDIDRGAVWVVELDSVNGAVRRKARLVEDLLDPQGIDVANGTLYVATSGRGVENRGNCVLRIRDVDALGASVLASGTSLAYDDGRVEEVNCGFTTIQPAGHSRGHAWRSLRVDPSAKRAYVNIGSDCNWQADCVPSATNAHTDFLAFDVEAGHASVVGHGIRNAVGMWFDTRGNLLWVDNASDDEEGVPGGIDGLHGNRPDGELNVLYKSRLAWLHNGTSAAQ